MTRPLQFTIGHRSPSRRPLLPSRDAAANNPLTRTRKGPTMAKITGVGGVFIKSKGDGAALAAWYQKHLGMTLSDFGGAVLRWPDDKADDRGLTVWHAAGKDSR